MKYILLASALVSTFLLMGCSSEDNALYDLAPLFEAKATETMNIDVADFSKQTKAILSLFNDDVKIFDFTVDESIRSFAIKIWKKDSAEWTDAGGIYGDVAGREMISLEVREEEVSCKSLETNGFTDYTYPDVGVEFTQSSMTVSGWLDNPTAIEADKEILLYSKYGTESNEIATNDLDFRSVNCDVGMAITITFFGDEIE